MGGIGARGRIARYSSSNKRESSGFTQPERRTGALDFWAVRLRGTGSILASLILVFSKIFFLVFLERLCLIADTLCRLDCSLAGEFIIWIGGRLADRQLPLVACRNQVFQGLADVGVLCVIGVEIVLQFVDQTGELLDLGSQFCGAILRVLIGRELFNGRDALLNEFRI